MTRRRSTSLLVLKMAIAGIGLGCLFGPSVFPTGVVGKRHNAEIRIGGGHLNSAEWISTLSHKKGAGPRSVCVSMALAVQADGVEISEGFECDLVRDSVPFIQSVSGHSRHGARSVFAAIFGPPVRKVVVDLGKGDGSLVRFRRLSEGKAAQLGIAQVGYWVHAFSGPVCVQRITAYDQNGSVLSDDKVGC